MAANFIDEVLAQCVYALGCGACMKIQREALIELRDHVADPRGAARGLRYELTRARDTSDPNDPEPGEDRWKIRKDFVLECCEAVGRLAAATAMRRGSRVIKREDLVSSYKTVSVENRGQLPGMFCPDNP